MSHVSQVKRNLHLADKCDNTCGTFVFRECIANAYVCLHCFSLSSLRRDPSAEELPLSPYSVDGDHSG